MIVHQIAPVDQSLWHPLWFKCHESWKKNHDVRVWNDAEEIDEFVKNYYPVYWNLYKLFPSHVMRIDFVRYCILHQFGGVYADMDIFCYKPIPPQTYDFVAVENLTKEFTSAVCENNLMYSTPKNPFLLQILNYIKMLFINSRNLFEKPYLRSYINDNLVNNITGSGMLDSAIRLFGNDTCSMFPTVTFNNRPASYDPSFYTKHIHTNIWGKEYITKQNLNQIIIMDGIMYQIDSVSNKLRSIIKHEPHYIMTINEFDFYTDYTKGIYLKDDNLSEIKAHIFSAEDRIRRYLSEGKYETNSYS